MTTVVKAADARAFLGLVPNMLGYHPTESVVLIPFVEHRTLGAMRFDLPTFDIHEYRPTAATMVGMVCKLPTADGVAIIVYSSQHDHHYASPLVKAAIERAGECGLRLVDALYVMTDGWGSFKEGAAPRPLSELSTTTVEGVTAPVGNQRSGAELPELSPLFLAEVTGAIATFEPEYMSDPVLLFEALLTMDLDDLFGEMVAYLHWALNLPPVRDIFLVQIAGDLAAGNQAMNAQLAWEGGVEYPAELAQRMWGEGEGRPDPERLAQALKLCRITAAAAPSAGAFATCSWLAWALGRSTEAEHYAKQGQEIDPEHTLCEIVRSFVHAGHLPGWAFQR